MIEDAPVTTPVAERHVPLGLRDRAERHAHIVQRLKERAGITWTVEQVAGLEMKIRTVRQMVNELKTPAPILPTKIGEGREGTVHYYRFLIAAKPHTAVWSQLAKCLITYAGPGELPNGIEAEAETVATEVAP